MLHLINLSDFIERLPGDQKQILEYMDTQLRQSFEAMFATDQEQRSV